MSEAKIEFTFGTISFAGEGSESWLSSELAKLIALLPTLTEIKPPAPQGSAGAASAETGPESGFKDALGSYLKAKGADSNQTKRFLATADWLRRRGAKTITTAAVTKALSDNHQKRLSNPADCLNKNVSKGFCEKTAGGFFITPDGLKDLGHQ